MNLTLVDGRRRWILAAGAVAVLGAGTWLLLPSEPVEASDPDPAVTINAPVDSTFPAADGCGVGDDYACSLPSEHHIVYFNPDVEGGGAPDDWAMDLQNPGGSGGVAGTPVVLRAVAQDGTSTLTARVQQINPACASGDLSLGGSAVSVAIYANGVEVGTVTYAHVDPTVSAGQDIGANETQIGVVGNYTAGSCWTGMHTHVELSSQHNYSCYVNRSPGQALVGTDAIGYLGGDFAAGQRAACA